LSRIDTVTHEFVESAPDNLEEGKVYVSIAFATVLHKCCCGCGNEVVTPLSPTEWRLTFDGETVSLYPSIGNFGLRCGSHYWIDRSRVRWADRWSQKQIDEGRAEDSRARKRRLKEKAAIAETASEPIASAVSRRAPGVRAWFSRGWSRVVAWLNRPSN
jgi:hypothetical protein